jgi:hypothetical protein
LEVAQEGFSRLDGDDRLAVLPHAIEQPRESPSAFRRVVLRRPNATEVAEQFFGLVEARIVEVA